MRAREKACNVAFNAGPFATARKMICSGEYEAAIKYTKQACQEALDYLDDDETTNASWVDANVNWFLDVVRESVELSVCGSHALTTFQKMIGATFALAPALIRSALKVKTAVPQSPLAGMFIIVLPWLYSPIVWVVFNVVFQLIGNWQLLVGLIAFAFGPMAFFVFGITKNVTRPFDDKEAKSMVRFFEFTQGMKVVCSGVFVLWGLYEFSFKENDEYFGQYKKHVFSSFGALQLAALASTMGAKYYYTTIVGVDYMLAQILYARKHEVLMSIHSKSDVWGSSTHAKLAAEIHKEYVKLLNLFCKIQDKDGRDGWATERDEKNRMSRGLSVEDWKAYKAAAPQTQAGQGLEMKDLKGKEDRGAGRGSEFSFENPMRARPSKVHAKSMSGEFSDGEVSSSSEEEGEGNDPPPPPGAPPPAGG